MIRAGPLALRLLALAANKQNSYLKHFSFRSLVFRDRREAKVFVRVVLGNCVTRLLMMKDARKKLVEKCRKMMRKREKKNFAFLSLSSIVERKMRNV